AADAATRAISELTRAVQLAPQQAELHYRLGLALLESERYAEALVPLRRAVQLAPERRGLQLPLAKALHRTGDDAGATAALAALVHAEPSPAEVTTARALMDRLADPFARFP